MIAFSGEMELRGQRAIDQSHTFDEKNNRKWWKKEDADQEEEEEI